jgi:signal transduction histidine kinase
VQERDGWPRHSPDAQGWSGWLGGLMADDHALVRGLAESVNHHLRTPVTAILCHAELLMDQGHVLPEEVQESLASIVRAGRRLKDVSRGMSDLIDAACVRANPVDTVDVSHVLAQEVATYLDRAEARGIRLAVVCDREVRCVAEPSRLRRALRELLDNAMTYAPDQSAVSVSATVAVTGIRITVRDHGTGIDGADRERLTRPFERGTHPRQPAGGLGMGLALASAVAAGHRGRLDLADAHGGGLAASLELPLDFTRPTPTPATP